MYINNIYIYIIYILEAEGGSSILDGSPALLSRGVVPRSLPSAKDTRLNLKLVYSESSVPSASTS